MITDMSLGTQIQMTGRIGLIEIVHKQPSFNPMTSIFPAFEPNPDYVKLRFFIGDIESHRSEVIVKKEDVKKLNMMLGEDVIIYISSNAFSVSDHPTAAAYSKAIIASVQMNSQAASQLARNSSSGTPYVISPSYSWNPQTGGRLNVHSPTEREEKPIDPKYLDYVDLNLHFQDAGGYGSLSVNKRDLLALNVTAADTIFIKIAKP